MGPPNPPPPPTRANGHQHGHLRTTTATAAKRAARAVAAYIRSAPGTYIWLAVLFVTTVALHQMSPDFEQDFLRQRSTNLHELSSNPVRVLFSSALWIDGGRWLPYAVLYTVFHAQAERWLGTLRWLTVALAAHILATLISEGALLWAIRHGIAPESAVNTLDVGVSYALAGIVGVLTYRIAPPWRYVYLLGVLIVYGTPLITGRTFTDLGHFTSVLIGLACYPLTRGRGPVWNPLVTLARARRRMHRVTSRP
ncbi:rhomboid-like protein [Streptomyces sp. NPDC091292]|uniref:rhomboid-like protein n=1 Tax=Streptomyces sp. NPDC091292 TaxID=3365991 RepID=UPI00382D859A